MDKNAIKKYAIWARNELIARVSQKALLYGITKNNMVDAAADSVGGKLLTDTEKKQRQALITQIKEKGFEQVIEEVAYTWFNRFSALRFMEVNGYLPTHVRVFTDEENNFKPQIITEAIHLEMDGLDMEKVYAFKEADKTEELYKYLLITQCNALNKILPRMFQRISDYTELLLPDNLLRESSVIEKMISLIPEEDWKDAVEVIGWLYQYYNTEPKDIVFGRPSGTRIKKEEMPAATQLFTPDWIVRYMVENSLGRLWQEGHPDSKLKEKLKYYLEAIEQDKNVQEQIDAIHKEYGSINPQSIYCIDPCMGSGHILAYMFDVLMQIYENYGFSTREAVESIIKHNLYGLDIDERAAQLSYFAIMMKARQYDRRFFSKSLQPHVYEIIESNDIDGYALEYFCGDNQKVSDAMKIIISEMHDAKEYGSMLKVSNDVDFELLYNRFEEIRSDINIAREIALETLLPLVEVAEVIAKKYHIVITNPPYLKADSLTPKMMDFILRYKESAKYDIYAAFIFRCNEYLCSNGIMSLITMHNFMFAPSFLDLRDEVKHWDWINMLHLGSRAFSEISGEVVQTAAYVISKTSVNRDMYVIDTTDEKIPEEKETKFLESKSDGYIFEIKKIDSIPGHAFGYALSERIIELYESNQLLDSFGVSKAGVVTGADDSFVRFWFEVDNTKITYAPERTKLYDYVLFSKGGTFSRWYGNAQNVLKLKDMWDDTKTNKSVRRGDIDYYYRRGIGWSQMGGGVNKAFSEIINCVCKTTTPMFYPLDSNKYLYILGYLNSGIPPVILKALNPTLSILTSDILNLPFLYNENANMRVEELVQDSYNCAKCEYSQMEENWQFETNPVVGKGLIANRVKDFCAIIEKKHNRMEQNARELHDIFIDVLDLKKTNDDNDNSDIKIDNVITVRDVIKRLISYAVGCMFGRYSLDRAGVVYAGGKWNDNNYQTFQTDTDNIMPICDDEYFEDDIVGCFIKFIETVYGKETLAENLKFIADALGGKGNPKDVIRNYFLNDFYNDHVKMYQKRPIYWQFDSGKKNGFKALIYMHRYREDTIARIRTDYVHEQQSRYRTAIADLEQRINGASTSDRVKLNKQLTKLKDQDTELRGYEEKIHHLADQMIRIDLDDGVKNNYEIFKDVLAKIK